MKKIFIFIFIFLLSSCLSTSFDENVTTFGDFGNSSGIEHGNCYFDKNIEKIICSGKDRYGLYKEGSLGNKLVEIDLPNINIKHFAFGNDHFCFSDENDLYCKGANYYGSNGLKKEVGKGIIKDFNKIKKKGIFELGLGFGYTCVLLDTGNVECIGKVNQKEYGHKFTKIDFDIKVIEISAGQSRLTLLTEDKEVYFYDYRDKIYKKIDLLNVEKIFSGHGHSCALLSNNDVKCWGGNSSGELGVKSGTLKDSFTTTDIDIDNIIDMSLGAMSSCALIADGTIKCWGSNASGQLGVGKDLTNSIEPIKVEGIDNAIELNCSHYSCCVLLDNNEFKCWGDKVYGFSGI